jgi:isoamylase
MLGTGSICCPVPIEMRASGIHVGPGRPSPLGITETCNGYNFAVFSRHAQSIELVLFGSMQGEVMDMISLNSDSHRTGDIWHAELMGELRGKSYALKVDGPFLPQEGHRFDPNILLLDPYAIATTGISGFETDRSLTREGGPSARALFADERFDWQDDKAPRHPWRETVLYETHVRGFTIHASSGVKNRGQYLGLIEKIPHFKKLGITAIELMPVQDFPDYEGGSAKHVRNYWGYSPVGLFAPKAGYGSGENDGSALSEFKTMVRELHKAGIEVILDVVCNHTAEGNESGPTFSFRGLDNAIYYLLAEDKQHYRDYSGCGNTLNCNHPVVRSMIIDCLRHWVCQFHIDGFRFDLASILGRDAQGKLLSNPPLLEQIAEDPILRHVKLIAEAWDLGGAFQVGRFPGHRWAEWNCYFRDEVRRFWRGDPGMNGAFAMRICGSADLYQANHESPLNSINFVTCHDGFTLNDLVSYSRKHNEENGEENRDGAEENYSQNNGVEGPSDDSEIESTRLQQIKNMLVTLLISRGVPMLLGGDEFRRTQRGNNNAYCQDNEMSWHDWSLIDRHAGLFRFVCLLIAFRKRYPVLTMERFYTDSEISWFGVGGEAPDWHGSENRFGCVIHDQVNGPTLCLLFNATHAHCIFAISALANGRWIYVVDTSKSSPMDIPDADKEPIVTGCEVAVPARSVSILAKAPAHQSAG